eukprot:PITA_36134
MWKTLKDLYEVKNTNRLLFLKSKILSFNMEENETVVAFISRIKELKNKLGDIDEAVSDIYLVTITMNGIRVGGLYKKNVKSAPNQALASSSMTIMDLWHQRKKSHFFEYFKGFRSMVEKHIGKCIRILRLDQGGEYKKDCVLKYYKDHGIQQQFTIPHTPQQNGVVGRKNKTFVECARSMLKDSDWARNVDDRRSLTGYAFSIGSGVITRSNKKQNTIFVYSAEAKYQAMCAATCEAVWLRRLLLYVREEKKVATMIKCDNHNSIKLANNLVFHKNTKHIDAQFHFVKEKVQSKEIHIEYCNSCGTVADSFTKPLGRLKFELFREVLGICVNPFLH